MTMTLRLELTFPLPGMADVARPEPGTPPRKGWDHARRRLVTKPARWLVLKALRAMANGGIECYPKTETIRETIAEMGYDPPGEESIRRRLRELETEDGLIARTRDGRLASRRRIRFTFLAAPKRGDVMSQEAGTRCPTMGGRDVPPWWDTMSHLVVPQVVTQPHVTSPSRARPNSIPIQTEKLTSILFQSAPDDEAGREVSVQQDPTDDEPVKEELTKTLTEMDARMQTKPPTRTKTPPPAEPVAPVPVTLEDQIAQWEAEAKLPPSNWKRQFALEGLKRVREEAAAVAAAPITTPGPDPVQSRRPSVAALPAPTHAHPAPAAAKPVPTPSRPVEADRGPAPAAAAIDPALIAMLSQARADAPATIPPRPAGHAPAGTAEAERLVWRFADDHSDATLSRLVECLQVTFRDRKAKTLEFWQSSMAELATGLLTPEVVVGLIRDAARKEIHLHANNFCQGLGAALREARSAAQTKPVGGSSC